MPNIFESFTKTTRESFLENFLVKIASFDRFFSLNHPVQLTAVLRLRNEFRSTLNQDHFSLSLAIKTCQKHNRVDTAPERLQRR